MARRNPEHYALHRNEVPAIPTCERLAGQQPDQKQRPSQREMLQGLIDTASTHKAKI